VVAHAIIERDPIAPVSACHAQQTLGSLQRQECCRQICLPVPQSLSSTIGALQRAMTSAGWARPATQ